MDVQEISRRLAEDSAEVTRSLDMFMNERISALRAQERALEVYDAEMAELDDGSLASSIDEPVDHNLMRHLNATRIAALSDDYDEFEQARIDLDQRMNAERRNIKKEKIEFDKGLEPKPDMPDAIAKANIRDEMFTFLDAARMEEMKLELEYEKLIEEIGLQRAEYAADNLLSLQKSNHSKLLDMFKLYQPQSFGKAWGNDPDYVQMAGELDAMIKKLDMEDGGQVASLEAAAKNRPKKAKKKKSAH